MNPIKQALNDLYQKEMFEPGMLGIFINPFYFARKFLRQAIQNNSGHLSGRLLDLGCGTKPYKNLFMVEEYIGIEIGDERDHTNKIIDKYYDGKTIPFEDNNFDSVFSSQVFEHIFNLEEILVEIHRVLKPGGHILVTLPFVWPEHEQPYDFARYSSFGIKSLFERNGFEVVKMEKTSNFPVTLCQLWSAYLSDLLTTRKRIINVILTVLFVSPINMAGMFFSMFKPKDVTLYLDNILVARKRISF